MGLRDMVCIREEEGLGNAMNGCVCAHGFEA